MSVLLINPVRRSVSLWGIFIISLKKQETNDAFTEELKIQVRKIVAPKPELGGAIQTLKHQYAHNMREPLL